ncbi:MAG: hypothetical protein F4Y04_03220 [Chloroflexi bacterium]|nr:hypothetical protein [Chloroflexota bacterium]
MRDATRYEVDDTSERFKKDVEAARRYDRRIDEMILGLLHVAERNPGQLEVSEGGIGEIVAKSGFVFRFHVDEAARRVRFLRLQYIGPLL